MARHSARMSRSIHDLSPYKLKPSPWPSTADAWKAVDEDDLIQCFRIEFWLRSKTVMAYYKRCRREKKALSSSKELIGRIALADLPWFLEGHHHKSLLTPRKRSGVTDLAQELAERPWLLIEEAGPLYDDAIKASAKDRNNNVNPLFLKIDPPFGRRIEQAVVNLIRERRRRLLDEARTFPAGSRYVLDLESERDVGRRRGRKYNWPAWVDYLKAWDRAHQKPPVDLETLGRTIFTKSGDFDDEETYRQHAAKAIRNAGRLISAAESGDWPPPLR
jgi:hypothetical protein